MTETRRRYYAPDNMTHLEDEESLLQSSETKDGVRSSSRRHGSHRPPKDPIVAILIGLVMILMFLSLLIYWIVYGLVSYLLRILAEINHTIRFPSSNGGFALPLNSPCDTISDGYQCAPSLSHTWGQYSPYYLVVSEIPPKPPTGCTVTFAQLLSRHGARFPTFDKSVVYNSTITKIKTTATNITGPYSFLADYEYSLGADELTSFGMQEMINSGIDFFMRYEALAEGTTPFIRASDQDRVVNSARKWSEGFHKAKIASGATNDSEYPFEIVEISEAEGMNNTLDHGLCTAFEESTTGKEAQKAFGDVFLPAITARLQKDLQITVLTDADTIALMDMCPFTVVAETIFVSKIMKSSRGMMGNDPSANPFCAIFTPAEWTNYDYFQILGKYYGFGSGAPLGPTQGVGFVNELIARLTSSPVQDRTSVNHTLDGDAANFPLDRTLYADFSHDNDMTGIFAALRLFDQTPALNQKIVMSVEEMEGYSASRTVPFAGRMIVEKLQCEGVKGEMVRVSLNGRVLPLEMCSGDELGRCMLDNFVGNLGFAASGGKWAECFAIASMRP